MDELSELSEKIFALLKGNGLQLVLFDADGAETTDPTAARRFFSAAPNIMVTVDEDSNSVQFSKGKSVGTTCDKIQQRVRTLVDRDFLMDFTTKVFGKTIQPRDYAYRAKMNKGVTMNESINSLLMAKVLQELGYTAGMSAKALQASIAGSDLNDIQRVLNKLVKDRKVEAIGYSKQASRDIIYGKRVEEAIMEVSTEKLAKYKTAASKDCTSADKEGDTERANKRYSGIIKATNKQFDNDAKKHKKPPSITESLSKMFGSAKTSRQTLENVRILVKHKTPVDESVRGARTRHISAIFLECNGERFRFSSNSLPGARAMAQHIAHGGTMTDKVGSYITESVAQMHKLQSFNKYVSVNNLINEDSSDVVSLVKENIQVIRTDLRKLTSAKTYETVKARLETFEKTQLDESNVDELQELFTIKRFDEKYKDVLPIIRQMVQERDSFHKRIEEAASLPIKLSSDKDVIAPVFEFTSANAKVGYRVSALAMRIQENEELSEFVGKIGSKLSKDGTVNTFEKAVLKQVLENAAVVRERSSVTEIAESVELDKFLSKYIPSYY